MCSPSQVELLCRVLQAVVEAGAAGACRQLPGVGAAEVIGRGLVGGGGEYDRLAGAYLQLEIARHPQILLVRQPPVAVLAVFHALVPVAVADPARFLVKLHVQFRVSGVQAGCYPPGDIAHGSVDSRVLDAQGVGVAECQEGAQLQRGARVGLLERVFDEYAVLVRDEHLLLGQYDAAHAVRQLRDALAVKLAYVFVPVGAERLRPVLVYAQVERRVMLYHRLVERREQHMGLVVHFRYRDYEQPVLLARVAPHDRGAVVSPGFVGAQHLLGEALLQVDHEALVKSQVTHIVCFCAARRACRQFMGWKCLYRHKFSPNI